MVLKVTRNQQCSKARENVATVTHGKNIPK